MVCARQDPDYLYMVMELAHGGELLKMIRRCAAEQEAMGHADVACSVETARFYVGEMILALEYLHRNSIIHRDLKPEK